MRSRLTSALAVIGAVTVLVLAANTVALAATGRDFLLGQSNQTAGLTTLQRITLGPALSLQTKNDDAAPFTTNAKGKVKNLNADTVDGLSSRTLRNALTLDGFDSAELLANLQSAGEVTHLASDSPGTEFIAGLEGLGGGSGISTLTYTLTLGGASGDTSCALEEAFAYGQSTLTWSPVQTWSSTADSPVFSESSVHGQSLHSIYRLHCTSDTPFGAYGDAVTSFIKH